MNQNWYIKASVDKSVNNNRITPNTPDEEYNHYCNFDKDHDDVTREHFTIIDSNKKQDEKLIFKFFLAFSSWFSAFNFFIRISFIQHNIKQNSLTVRIGKKQRIKFIYK